MSGDWIKLEVGTPDKPEIWAIAERLSIDPDAVVGKMIRVWSWFDQQTENGNAASVSKSLLDRVVGVTGFCNAVIAAGWMAEQDGMILLPNFDRHNGKTAKNRALTAKRVAKFKDKTNDTGNASVTLNPLPREEKRREDKKKEQQGGVLFDLTCWPSRPSNQVFDDWLAMRKRLKADVSQTVINQFGVQFQLAALEGYSVDQCLSECIASNWRGFKFAWIKNQEASHATRKQPVKPSRGDQFDAAFDQAFGTGTAGAIEGDFERVGEHGADEQFQ